MHKWIPGSYQVVLQEALFLMQWVMNLLLHLLNSSKFTHWTRNDCPSPFLLCFLVDLEPPRLGWTIWWLEFPKHWQTQVLSLVVRCVIQNHLLYMIIVTTLCSTINHFFCAFSNFTVTHNQEPISVICKVRTVTQAPSSSIPCFFPKVFLYRH